MRTCSKCQQDKLNKEFRTQFKRKKWALRSECKECEGEYWKDYRKKQDKLSKRDYMLRWNYGITEIQYQDLFQKQNGCCWVCGKHQSKLKRSLAVDHLHRPPFPIRGLLCNFCNRYVIARHSDPLLFDKAAAYLRQETGLFAIPSKRKRRRRKKMVIE